MRIKDLLSEAQLDELTFMGSQCTKDCSGHRAGYQWSLARGGVENPASPSQSFINGSNIGHRQVQQNKQQRKQGGGKIRGYQSQTANAVAKRQARAQAKVNQGVQGTPQTEGWQDFNKVEPYYVCLAGKPIKLFNYYEDARRFHDNWKKKLYREGDRAKADKITLMPKMDEHIVKVGSEYELKSKRSGKNLGKYPTRAGAEKRERQVQYFKNR